MKKLSLNGLWSQGAFLNNVFSLFRGNLPGHVIVLLISPILTRLYSPEDIGLSGLVIIFVSLATVVTSLRYEYSIVTEPTNYIAIFIMKFCFIIALPLSLISTSLGGVFIQQKWFGFEVLPYSSLFLIFLYTYLATQLNTLRYWFIRTENYSPISKQVVSLNLTRALLLIGLGYINPSWIIYLIAEIVSRLVSLVFFVKALPKKVFDFSRISQKKVAFICKKHIELPKINMPSTFINAFTESLPVPFIAAAFGIDIAGYYLLMNRVVLGTSSIVSSVVADAFHGRLARIAKDNKDYLFIFFKKTLLLLLAIATLQFLTLVFFAPQIFSLVFGSKWVLAGTLAQLTAPWAFFVIIVSPLSRVVFVYDKQKTKLVNDIIVLLLTFTAMGLSKYFVFSVEQTTASFAIARVISYSLYFVVMWKFVKHPETIK